MNFEEVYYYFVVFQKRKMHTTAPAGIFLEFEWEQFFMPKKDIVTPDDKECWESWRLK